MRKFTGVLSRTNTVLIFINQIRMKIGVMFGNPETTTGGNALKFYSSIRIDIRKTTQIKEGQDVDRQPDQGQDRQEQGGAALQAWPNSTSSSAKGHLRTGDLLDLGVAQGIVDKSGAWYSYQDERIGQGRENAKKFLKEHPDTMDEIERKLRLAFGMPVDGDPNAT
jgi:recombination protein RecA